MVQHVGRCLRESHRPTFGRDRDTRLDVSVAESEQAFRVALLRTPGAFFVAFDVPVVPDPPDLTSSLEFSHRFSFLGSEVTLSDPRRHPHAIATNQRRDAKARAVRSAAESWFEEAVGRAVRAPAFSDSAPGGKEVVA